MYCNPPLKNILCDEIRIAVDKKCFGLVGDAHLAAVGFSKAKHEPNGTVGQSSFMEYNVISYNCSCKYLYIYLYIYIYS